MRGIVDDDHVAALAGQGASDAGGHHHALVVVAELVLAVHIVLQVEAVAPVCLEPDAADNITGEDVVLPGKVVGIADFDKTLLWRLQPGPHGIADCGMDAFHVPWWDVDDQTVDLSEIDGLEVFADEVGVPVLDVGCARFNDWPGLANKLGKAALRPLLFDGGLQRIRVKHPALDEV